LKLILAHSGDSFLHQLDPRIKVAWLIGNCTAVFFSNEIPQLALIMTSIAVTAVASRISLQVFLPVFKISLFIGVQLVLLLGVLRPEGQILVEVAFVKLYAGGVAAGVQSWLRLLDLCCLLLQFVIWTSPEHLTLLMAKLGIPHQYAVLPGLALRFLPILEKDLKVIFETLQARGLELTSIRQKCRGLLTVVLPLVLTTLKRSEEVSLYMELKGYGRYSTRTVLTSLSFRRRDWVGLVSICCYFAVITAWAYRA
jgi:energy-coupling factor transport system permease protein